MSRSWRGQEKPAVLAENFAFYSPIYDALPEGQMRQLAGEADFAVEQAKDGRVGSVPPARSRAGSSYSAAATKLASRLPGLPKGWSCRVERHRNQTNSRIGLLRSSRW